MFRGRKDQKFYRAEVEFCLHKEKEVIANGREISASGDVLPDMFVGVFNQTYDWCLRFFFRFYQEMTTTPMYVDGDMERSMLRWLLSAHFSSGE